MLFAPAKIRIPIALSATLLVCAFTARAQFQVESWTTDNGLPQNTVSSVLQTRDGYIWLATLDGLVRYDGVKFTTFNRQNSPGVGSNRFTKLKEDDEGNLWAATEDAGIVRYSQGSFHTYGAAEGVDLRGVIYRLWLDNHGTLIVVTDVSMIRWNGQRFTPYLPVAGENKDSLIMWSRDGAFWWTNDSTLHRWRDGQVTDFAMADNAAKERIASIFEDSRGRIWVSVRRSGLFILENDKFSIVFPRPAIPDDTYGAMLEDRDGNVWVLSADGAFLIAPNGQVSHLGTEQGLSHNALTSAFEDREGNIWLGTFYRGLNRLTKQSIKFLSRSDGLLSDITNPIYEDRSGTIWIGGKDLTRFQAGKFGGLPGRTKWSGGEVTSIYEDREGRLWFGHWNGIYYFQNGRFTDFSATEEVPLAVHAMLQDRTGAMWYGTREGLYRFANGVRSVYTTADGLSGNSVKALIEAPDGTIWVGTYGGISRFKDERISSFTDKDGLAGNQIRSLYLDSDGVLWIGSYEGGLTRFKEGKFVRYTSNNGLYNDGVFQILEDDSQNLWMSCNRGIYRVAKQQLNDFADGKISRISSTAYGKADGLLETECNGGQQPAGIRTRDGKLWFPTQRGVAVIDPATIRTNKFPPPVLIESYSLNGTVAAPAGVINIAPNIENLEIAYTGLSFVKPDQVHFRYKLIGWDRDWIDADARRVAYYSHLSPGEYTFIVIAANSDGVWSPIGASIRVVVRPPFYRTWWFIALLVVAVGGGAALIYRRRLLQFRREKAQQEKFARSLIESQERERGRIAAELHDGLSQTLVIIKNRAVLSLTAPDDHEWAFEQMEEISSAASEAMLEAKDIIYDLRPIQLDRFGLTKAVQAMVIKIGQAQAIEFVTELEPVDGKLDKESESSLYRILQESVNNIIRHSRATKATISMVNRTDAVVTTVTDNGRGFTPGTIVADENHRGGFGLVGMVERARLLHGQVNVQSAPDRGTVITIILPATGGASGEGR